MKMLKVGQVKDLVFRYRNRTEILAKTERLIKTETKLLAETEYIQNQNFSITRLHPFAFYNQPLKSFE